MICNCKSYLEINSVTLRPDIRASELELYTLQSSRGLFCHKLPECLLITEFRGQVSEQVEMLKFFWLSAFLLVLVVGQNTNEQADEESLEDEVQLQDDDKQQDEVVNDDVTDPKSSNIRSRSNIKKRPSYDDYAYPDYDSKPRKKPNNGGRQNGGRVNAGRPKKHRELGREPQRGPLITPEDICYRLKLNVLRDFERYIDLYIEKCKINSI